MKTASIEEIERRYQPGKGRHWFDKNTLRFFRSRLAVQGYESENGLVFFVSSEQAPHSRRRYSVRALLGPGGIETVYGFQAFTSSGAATKAAQKLAKDNHPRCFFGAALKLCADCVENDHMQSAHHWAQQAECRLTDDRPHPGLILPRKRAALPWEAWVSLVRELQPA